MRLAFRLQLGLKESVDVFTFKRSKINNFLFLCQTCSHVAAQFWRDCRHSDAWHDFDHASHFQHMMSLFLLSARNTCEVNPAGLENVPCGVNSSSRLKLSLTSVFAGFTPPPSRKSLHSTNIPPPHNIRSGVARRPRSSPSYSPVTLIIRSPSVSAV